MLVGRCCLTSAWVLRRVLDALTAREQCRLVRVSRATHALGRGQPIETGTALPRATELCAVLSYWRWPTLKAADLKAVLREHTAPPSSSSSSDSVQQRVRAQQLLHQLKFVALSFKEYTQLQPSLPPLTRLGLFRGGKAARCAANCLRSLELHPTQVGSLTHLVLQTCGDTCSWFTTFSGAQHLVSLRHLLLTGTFAGDLLRLLDADAFRHTLATLCVEFVYSKQAVHLTLPPWVGENRDLRLTMKGKENARYFTADALTRVSFVGFEHVQNLTLELVDVDGSALRVCSALRSVRLKGLFHVQLQNSLTTLEEWRMVDCGLHRNSWPDARCEALKWFVWLESTTSAWREAAVRLKWQGDKTPWFVLSDFPRLHTLRVSLVYVFLVPPVASWSLTNLELHSAAQRWKVQSLGALPALSELKLRGVVPEFGERRLRGHGRRGGVGGGETGRLNEPDDFFHELVTDACTRPQPTFRVPSPTVCAFPALTELRCSSPIGHTIGYIPTPQPRLTAWPVLPRLRFLHLAHAVPAQFPMTSLAAICPRLQSLRLEDEHIPEFLRSSRLPQTIQSLRVAGPTFVACEPQKVNRVFGDDDNEDRVRPSVRSLDCTFRYRGDLHQLLVVQFPHTTALTLRTGSLDGLAEALRELARQQLARRLQRLVLVQDHAHSVVQFPHEKQHAKACRKALVAARLPSSCDVAIQSPECVNCAQCWYVPILLPEQRKHVPKTKAFFRW